MRTLITGAGGFLGKALLKRLLAHNYDTIRCNVRRRSDISKLAALAEQNPHTRLEYCVGNLRYRDDAARAVNDAQLIFHLAAGKKGAAADLLLDSAIASRNLLDAVADPKRLRIVLISSFGVYGVAGLGRSALVNEQTILEPHPEWRDHYSSAKLRQEQLFWEYQRRYGFELVVLRPGVIYGPEGGHFSNRVGLRLGNCRLHFGGDNPLPLTYVDNCAEALVVAGTHPDAPGQVYNVVDNDLPTCREYLRAYKKNVTNIRSISVPYAGVRLISTMIAKYNKRSNGQLPAFLTPYRAANLWSGNRFENSKLKSTGWKQLVSTQEGLQRTFAAFRTELEAARMPKPSPLADAVTNPEEVACMLCSSRSEELVVGAALGPDYNGSLARLLGAVSNLREAGQPAKLVIFAVRDTQEFADTAGIQGLRPHIQWVPSELNTRDVLRKCDVLVSLQDGVPLVVLQAIALHIPILTTAVRVPEAIRNLPNVAFSRRGDQNALQEALLRLSKLPKRNPVASSLPNNRIAKYYSDTYLWRENGPHNGNEPTPKSRVLIKQALFSAVPVRQLLQHGNRERPQIALTIDDGPDPVYTPRILDIFRDYGVKATFFVVGGSAEQHPEIVLRMKKEGHDVGNHSYSHPYFHRLSWRGAIREIGMTRSVLNRILGEDCMLFRPPHGKLSLRSLIPAWAAGQQVVMWNVDLKDYRASAGEVEAQLDRTPFSSGDIVLYHGTNEAALNALPRVIEAAIDKGREAVTISELTQPNCSECGDSLHVPKLGSAGELRK